MTRVGQQVGLDASTPSWASTLSTFTGSEMVVTMELRVALSQMNEARLDDLRGGRGREGNRRPTAGLSAATTRDASV